MRTILEGEFDPIRVEMSHLHPDVKPFCSVLGVSVTADEEGR
jgi:hypothetical protein